MTERVAVITGASHGLGEALARRFHAAGFRLHLIARSAGKLEALKTELATALGRANCEIHPCDLADPGAVELFVEHIAHSGEAIDVLVNNAAIQGPIGLFSDNDPIEWAQTLQVNLLAPVALCRAVLRFMPASGGSIINLSGGGATGPRMNFSAYATAKAALVRFSETLAEELKERNIRVNCVAPGAMKTAMLEKVLAAGHAAGAREYEAARGVVANGGASLESVCDLIEFLASDGSPGITGKLISAVWDRWRDWPSHLAELGGSDVYTLRRIAGRDRRMEWGDK